MTPSVPEMDAFEELPPVREPAVSAFDDLDVADEPRLPNPVHEMIASAEMALGETNIPRITIHAFLMESDTAEVVEKAAGDSVIIDLEDAVGVAVAVVQGQ